MRRGGRVGTGPSRRVGSRRRQRQRPQRPAEATAAQRGAAAAASCAAQAAARPPTFITLPISSLVSTIFFRIWRNRMFSASAFFFSSEWPARAERAARERAACVGQAAEGVPPQAASPVRQATRHGEEMQAFMGMMAWNRRRAAQHWQTRAGVPAQASTAPAPDRSGTRLWWRPPAAPSSPPAPTPSA